MLFFLSKISFAANDDVLENVDTLVDRLVDQIVNPVIGFAFAAALVFFLYGVFQFVLNRDTDDKRTEGKQHMLWGIVGMAIMVMVFGIINLIKATIGA